MDNFIQDKNNLPYFYEKERQLHIKIFGVEPNIIGMFWFDNEILINNIIKAIEANKPYDEYELLSDDEKKAFDDGDLLF
jgi:hypothetical protein